MIVYVDVGGQGAPGSLFTRIINFNDLPDWEKVSFVDRVCDNNSSKRNLVHKVYSRRKLIKIFVVCCVSLCR